jgi:RND superfamily putative drug exporter
MRTLAGWCVRHRRLVLLFWAVALIVSLGVSSAVGSRFANTFSLPNTPSANAVKLLQASAPKNAGDTEQVAFEAAKGYTVTNPAIETRINAMIKRFEALPNVGNVVSPYTPQGAQDIDATHTIAFVSVTLDKEAQVLSSKFAQRFVKVATSTSDHVVKVAVSGLLAEYANPPNVGGLLPGIVLALIVLGLIFGSFFAALLPIISALFALGTAFGIVTIMSHFLNTATFAPELVFLIGLGVGVDYALFIVTRHRQGLVAGRDVEGSIVNAVNTSGRAVLFAGIVVCIALLGMLAIGVSFLYGLAVAAAIGVLLTMFSALTLLPAMLGFIGPKVMSRKQKKNLAENGPRIVGADNKGFWPGWADIVRNRPLVPALVALTVIVILALPFFSLRLGSADQGSDPAGTTTHIAFEMLSKGFGPGFNGPLQVVSVVHDTAQRDVITNAVAAISRQPDVKSVNPPIYLPSKTGGQVAFINIFSDSSPQAVATTNLVNNLRNDTIPRAVGSSGLKVYVGGSTAGFIDFAHVLGAKLPLFIGLVVLLSFLLLSVVFRSFVIPLTGAVMNLLSIGAAFGMLVAVVQYGYLASIFGFTQTGPVEAFLPVMLFSIVFGLSMDYQVFLVSRIHEEYLKCGDTRTAVRNGLAATGKTVTAAALIMILVFGSFILGGQLVIKEFGIGLAGGILVDAVFIRMAVVPALMSVLGRANWWFPAWLDKALPRLSVEAEDLNTETAITTSTDPDPDPDPEMALPRQ